MSDLPQPGLLELLGIGLKDLVSLVGAGGKTTLMYLLADEAAAKGFSVLVTTTTAIFHPEKEGRHLPTIIGEASTVVLKGKHASGNRIMVAAREFNAETGKLAGFLPDQVVSIHRAQVYDLILVEADGAKHKPVKAPADHEPVIPAESTGIVGVIGLDCLGSVVNEDTVHRSVLFSHLTGIPLGEPITIPSLLTLISARDGLFKLAPESARKLLVLNKSDHPGLKQTGIEIGTRIIQGRQSTVIDRVLVSALNHHPPFFQLVD